MLNFEITCFRRSNPRRTLVISVWAADVNDAFEKVIAMGYEPVCW